MMHVICEIQLKPDTRDQYLSALQQCLPNILNCEGCEFFYPLIDLPPAIDYTKADFPTPRHDFVTVVEKWQTMQHYNNYMNSAIKDAFGAMVYPLIESATIRILSEPDTLFS